MKKTLLFALLMSAASVSYSQVINGTWKGLLMAANQKLEIVFHFQHEEDGKPSCKMDVPAQSAVGIPVNLQTLTDDSVSLSVAAIKMEQLKENSISSVCLSRLNLDREK